MLGLRDERIRDLRGKVDSNGPAAVSPPSRVCTSEMEMHEHVLDLVACCHTVALVRLRLAISDPSSYLIVLTTPHFCFCHRGEESCGPIVIVVIFEQPVEKTTCAPLYSPVRSLDCRRADPGATAAASTEMYEMWESRFETSMAF